MHLFNSPCNEIIYHCYYDLNVTCCISKYIYILFSTCTSQGLYLTDKCIQIILIMCIRTEIKHLMMPGALFFYANWSNVAATAMLIC